MNKKNKKVYLEDFNEICSEDNKIELNFIEKEQTQIILRYLHQIDEPYKEVFMLHVFGELSLKDISALFNKSESWARVIFYRAKIKIIEKYREGV